MITAKLRHLRIAPRKVRLVADLIRGLSFNEAEKQLRFSVKRAAKPILKLLNSGAANAKHNFNLDKESLFVEQIIVDVGPSLKRQLPRAMGRATPILKRTSHVTLVLGTKEEKGKERLDAVQAEPLEKETEKKQLVKKQETIEKVVKKEKPVKRPIPAKRPYGSTAQSKKRFFSRQTFGNVKKFFRRKSM